MRTYTNKLIEMAEEGLIRWEELARNCMCYMSESDVQDMAEFNDYIEEETT